MHPEDTIDEELNGAFGRENPFSVSADYFSELEKTVLSATFLEDQKIKRSEMVFSIPGHYFEGLPDQIMSQISLGDHKANTLSVPDGYFVSLEEKILTRTANPPQTTVVKRLSSPRIWKFATAACLLIALGSTLWFSRSSANYDVQNELSALPDMDIESYLEENTGSNDMNLLMENMDHDINMKPVSRQVDDATLKNYIETQL